MHSRGCADYKGVIMAVGLLESFSLIEEHGKEVLTIDELLFAADARRRKGCRSITSTLVKSDIEKVMEFGRRIKKWKDSK